MATNLVGKRLLLLGGTPLMCHVVKKAKGVGVYTIVTDYYDNRRAPAKILADEAYNVSTLDVAGLIDLVVKVRADGVFTGYSDITLRPCRMVCEHFGFPFYASLPQLDQTLNKRKFKTLCRSHGIAVVDDVDPSSLQEPQNKSFFPVIVKPADSYSSRGITVCHDAASLDSAYEKALGKSSSGEIVVERYIDADDIYLYLTIQDGFLSLSAMADRLLNFEQPGLAPQPVGYFFPSRYIDQYYAQLHAKLQAMVDTIGLKNGTFFVQGFAVAGKLTLFEMGLRLSGGAGYLSIEHENRIDLVKMHVRYALSGDFAGWSIRSNDQPRFRRPHCVLVVLLKSGTIREIRGLEEITNNPAVFHVLQLKGNGDCIDQPGTLEQVFGRIYLSAPDVDRLRQAVEEVIGQLRVVDDLGRNMILNSFEPNRVFADISARTGSAFSTSPVNAGTDVRSRT